MQILHIYPDYIAGRCEGHGSAHGDSGEALVDAILYDARGHVVWTTGRRVGFRPPR